MKIVTVNGRDYSAEALTRAIADSPSSHAPIELTVESGGFFKDCHVDYHGGLKIPHLDRVPGTVDLLASIAAPKASE
jgi:hypothetical protein